MRNPFLADAAAVSCSGPDHAAAHLRGCRLPYAPAAKLLFDEDEIAEYHPEQQRLAQQAVTFL